MVLSCSNIVKPFGEEHTLKRVPSHLEEYEETAIVGINGTGKSTPLKVTIGELFADQGVAALDEGASISYLTQHQDLDSESTIYDVPLEVKRPAIQTEERIHGLGLEMKSTTGDVLEPMLSEYSHLNRPFELANGYVYRSEITDALKGLGFEEEEFTKHTSTFPGGQKTRVSLGKLFLTKPSILLLDEPTDHLDMESIAWLETYLKSYSGSVIIVVHDRYFLNRVVTKIVELDNRTVTIFSGNYSVYNDKKAMLRDARVRAYLNRQQGIRHQKEMIIRLKPFSRERPTRRAENQERTLGKIEGLGKPVDINDSMDIRLEPGMVSGNDVLLAAGLGKSFGSQTLFSNVGFEIKRGEQVAIIGNNGTGETIFLKIINGLLDADSGKICLGSKAHVGYHDQEHQVLHMEKMLFGETQDIYPSMNNTQIRNTLASLPFAGDNAFKLIKGLSGGKQGRVSLAKLMLSDASFLLLDKLTNHLDIAFKEILESTLCRYTGTVLYMPHDRYFINRTTIRILDLTSRSLVNYVGNYNYYLGGKEDVEAAFAARNPSPASSSKGGLEAVSFVGSPASDVEVDRKAQKEKQARIRKRQNEPEKTEDSIHALETRDSEVGGLLTQEEVYIDAARLMELNREKEGIASRLEELYQRWEELAED